MNGSMRHSLIGCFARCKNATQQLSLRNYLPTPRSFTLAIVFCAVAAGPAGAAFVIERSGSDDPVTQGFGTFFSGGTSAAGVTNDMGHDGWMITTAGPSQAQHLYVGGGLSTEQFNDVFSLGFALTFEARVELGQARPYEPANPYTVAAAIFDTPSRRFDVFLGVDPNGDTVAVLPTSIVISSDGFPIPGPSYTLVGSGSTWHTYQLVYDPQTQLARLFIDGVERLDGYAGHSAFVANFGLLFGAIGGGTAVFDLVRVATIPEPGTLLLAAIGLAAALAGRCTRRR